MYALLLLLMMMVLLLLLLKIWGGRGSYCSVIVF